MRLGGLLCLKYVSLSTTNLHDVITDYLLALDLANCDELECILVNCLHTIVERRLASSDQEWAQYAQKHAKKLMPTICTKLQTLAASPNDGTAQLIELLKIYRTLLATNCDQLNAEEMCPHVLQCVQHCDTDVRLAAIKCLYKMVGFSSVYPHISAVVVTFHLIPYSIRSADA